MLNDLGSEVTVVELDKEILPGLDKRTSGELRKQLSSRGVDFKLSTSVTNISDKVVDFSDDTSDSFDCVLVAVGRAPLTENIGLEEIGVNVNKGFVEVDLKTMQTNLNGVFAAGDIVRGASLVVWAIRDGRDAAVQIEKYLKNLDSKKEAAA